MYYPENTLLDFANFYQATRREYIEMFTSNSDEEFDKGLETLLELAFQDLEADADNYAVLNEDGLSSILVKWLNRSGVNAMRESRSKGHVDITVCSLKLPQRIRLGEAKIYDGPAYHVTGMKQLLTRYTTGRESFGFMVSYVKDDGISELVEKIKAHIKTKKSLNLIKEPISHRVKWAFVTTHKHQSGEEYKLVHFSVNLFSE